MEVKVINISGKETGAKVQLPDAIFAVEPNDHAIYLDVKQYLANQRQGTHKSKQRNEIAGSTKKLYKQKGTGGARSGSIKSPLFNGGGRVFGPQPRDYSFKLNKKLKSLARKSALTYKAKDNNIVVLEAFSFDSIKTANYVKIMADLKLTDAKTLLV
jgi:large subunit ribosomal protein L4